MVITLSIYSIPLTSINYIDIPEIFQWKNPIKTAIFAVAVNLIYFGSLISGTGLIYLILNYSFFFIITAFVYVRIKEFLDTAQSADEKSTQEE